MADLNVQLRHNPIAIIGMGSIMPEARNLQEFWDNIVSKVDCITDVPLSRWDINDYYDPDPTVPDKTYCKRGGFIPEVDFDPMEFGLPPNILEVTDVSQMLSLLVAKEALTDAGYIQAADEIRERTGVILGVGGGQKLLTPLTSRLQYPIWDRVLESYGIGDDDRQNIIERMKMAYIRWEENSFPGMLGNVVAGRITNRFDLGGTNCVVDAACASTMAALKMALSELTERRADMMVTGGVDTDNSIFMYMSFSKTPAFSRGTNPRPFDVNSDGMMVGEGIGMMVLKRLEDAERDGDRIYAVIKGLGSSSDGRFKSIYAPRGEGQEKALRRAYDDAGFSPSTIGLVEAHGTGTVAGDTTEVTTIIRYFNQHDTEKQHIALGSVKSQIGHTKASAGAAGLIKTSLALYHKILPPTLNVDEPNPKFDMPNSSFYISGETRPWIKASDDSPRRAGVSSFGFGGTNFHVVLEEYTGEHKKAYRLHHTPQSVILSADTPADLSNKIQQIISQLQSEDHQQHFLNLLDETQQAKVPSSAARVGFVATSASESLPLLQVALDTLSSKPQAEEWNHPKGIFYRRSGMQVAGHVVALFAGQGSQYLNMGRELALNFPEIRDAFANLDALMSRDGKRKLSSVVYPPPTFSAEERQGHESWLQSTDYAQPAIGALSAGMYQLLRRAGFQADFAAGHSFGELSALWASGALSDADYYTLVKARGAAMAPPANAADFDAGTMLAVTGDVEAIEREVANLNGVEVANRNSRSQVVVAGAKGAVANAEVALKEKGFKVTPLPVSAAFHTSLVGHAQKPFADAIGKASFNTPKARVYSNTTGQQYPADVSVMQQMLSEHILKPVLFRDEIENLYAAGGTVFVEFGPRNVLTNLVKDILGDRPYVAVALNSGRQKDSDRQFREAVVQLQVLGLPLDQLDPYRVDPVRPAAKKKGMNVKLSGASYVSDKTRTAYEQALADKRHVHIENAVVSAPQIKAEEPVTVQVSPTKTPETPVSDPVVTSTHAPQPEEIADVDMNTILQSLENSLTRFREHQQETLRVHEQYAQSQSEYFRIFFDLTQQQQQLLASQTLPANVAEAFSHNMMRFHDYQSETLRMHDQYMQQQTEVAQSLLEIIRQQYSSMSGAPVSSANGVKPYVATAPVASVPKPAPVVTQVAKVEVPVAKPVTAAPQVQPVVVEKPVSAPAPVVTAPVSPPVASEPSADVSALSEAMLRIVGDKTGYPVEMLELSMDMEADLGIDSIKRVEILGAMRDEFPDMPQFSPEQLGELRTLEQIVDYMRDQSGGVGAPSAPAVVAQAAAPVAQTPVAQTQAPVTQNDVAAQPSADVSALSEAMLRIVGDKTGYPVEMLELSMDMEADLGIDSIKRVEILGAMRDEFPDMPQFSPEQLGELRTLEQIVDYMREQSDGVATPNAAPVAATSPVVAPVAETPAPVATTPANGSVAAEAASNVDALSEAMLRIVGDKTGYPVEMLELSMDMEADLGIDSIKRVEILGAMRDEFPDMPQFSPEQLGELRTLEQIVDYMEEVSRQAAPFDLSGSTVSTESDEVSVTASANVLPPVHGIQRALVETRRLPAPDFQEYSVSHAVGLILDDGTAATTAVANHLAQQGWDTVVLSLPATLVASNANLNGFTRRIVLEDIEETSIQNALTAVSQQYGNIGAYIQLTPVIGRNGDSMFQNAEKALVKFAFLMAKHLKVHLTTGNGTGRKSFITVTRLDGAMGTGNAAGSGAIIGGLFGLVKTLNLEWNSVFCRAIDVTPDADSEQIAQYVMAEMHDPNRLLTEVAYGPQGRTTLVMKPSHNNGVH